MVDKLLLESIKLDNLGAFEELYRDYWRQVQRFASLYIKDREEVREVVQDVFVNVWESRQNIKNGENFNGFLFIITRNCVFNRSRSKTFNVDLYTTTLYDALEYSYSMDDILEAKELEAEIDRLIEDMPPQRKLVFKLSRKQHKTYKEIAEELGISEKTVERHINEALKYLRTNLKLLLIFISLFS
jgi:RNA polymerase sigma-70 factor (ECF subfamily)